MMGEQCNQDNDCDWYAKDIEDNGTHRKCLRSMMSTLRTKGSGDAWRYDLPARLLNRRKVRSSNISMQAIATNTSSGKMKIVIAE
jgi:hypothetical protein